MSSFSLFCNIQTINQISLFFIYNIYNIILYVYDFIIEYKYTTIEYNKNKKIY